MVFIENIQDFSGYVHKNFKKVKKSNIMLFYYEFAFLVMQNPFFSVTLEFLSGLLRLVQFLSITINMNFSNCWTNNTFLVVVTGFLDYLNVVPLFKGNDTIYIILFYFCIFGMILILVGWILLIRYSVTSQATNNIAFRIFKFLLVVLSSCFYVPLIKVFLGLLWKVDGKYVFYSTTKITEPLRYINIIVGCVFSFLMILFSLATQSVLFEIRYSKERKYAKTSCKCDLEIIIGQSFLVVINILIESQWVQIVFCIVISFIILIDYVNLNPYYNKFLQRIYLIFLSVFAWSSLVLLLAKIIKGFSGSIYLFFLGIPIIVLVCANFHDESITLIMKTISKCETQVQCLKHIEYLLDVVQTKENGRRAKIIIDGYIRLFEENCHISNCTLYQYLNSTEKKQYKMLLYQHIVELYKIAIKRFPEYVKLRISYASFINDVMKKKTESLVILDHNLLVTPSIEDQFLIYRITREITEDTYLNANSNTTLKADSAANVSMANLNYKNKFTEFRQQMTDVSTFYVEFWNLLMTEGSEAEKLLKLNNIGTKITEKVEECDLSFQKLYKMNPVDYLVLFYYSEFLRKVTNKVELANKYKDIYEKIIQDIHCEEKEDVFFASINSGSSNQSDDFQFILATTGEENFGIIKNISLGMCIVLGYTREEIVGKHINLIIPEIFRDSHDKMLQQKYSQFKDREYAELEKDKDTSSFRLIETFGLRKSKYLTELNFRGGIFRTETAGDMLIARSTKMLKENLQEQTSKACFILTNINFGIQSFTPSANSLLQFHSSLLNKNIDVTKLIKEFTEKFLELMMIKREKEDKVSVTKLKREIAETYFLKPTLVNVRIADTNMGESSSINNTPRKLGVSGAKSDKNFLSTVGMSSFSLNKFKMPSFFQSKMISEKNEFMMEIKKVNINNNHKGYIIKFEKPKKEVESDKKLVTEKTGGGNLMKDLGENAQRKEEAREDMDNLLKNIDKVMEKNKGKTFTIDPEKLSYVVNNEHTIAEERSKLKEKALSKIVKVQPPEEVQESNEEPEESESYESSGNEESNTDQNENSEVDDYSSKPQDDKEEDLNDSEDESLSKKEKDKQKKINHSSYYQVKMTNIRLMVYDYKIKRPKEVTYEKISKVEETTRPVQGKEEQTEEAGKTEGATQSKPGEQQEFQSSEFGAIQNEISKSTSHQILENTLSKKETQPSLVMLKICSASSFVILLVFIALWFYFLNDAFSTLNKNMILIEKGYQLIAHSLNSMIYVRQLNLIQNENFTNFVSSNTREEELQSILTALNDSYNIQHTIMKEIITSDMSLKKSSETKLDSDVVNMSIIDPETFVRNTFEVNIQSAITGGYTSLRHIIVDNKEINDFIPTNTDIYYFLENTANGIYKAEESQINVYSSELKSQISQIHNQSIIVLLLLIPVSVICFFFIVCYFRRSTKRKEQYLIIFFDIGINVIKGLLANCEIFNTKIQSESVIDFFNEDENIENDLDLDINTVQMKEMSKRKLKKNHLEHIDASAQENLHLEILLCLFFVIIFFLNFLVFFFADKSVKSYKDYLQIFANQMDNSNEYRKLFINTREYGFGTNNFISVEEGATNLTKYFENFQTKISQKQNSVLQNQVLSRKLLNKIFGYYQTNLCQLGFTNTTSCENLKNIGVEYGMNVLLSSYFFILKEVNSRIDYINYLSKTKGFVYNMTLSGTSEIDHLIPSGNNEEYFKFHPITAFNKETFGLAGRGYISVINPCFESIFESFVDEINSIYNDLLILFNFLLGGFALLIILCYFGVWIKFENKLNNTIYKTKNMLSIIPVNILCNIPTVFQVLEIKSMSKNEDGKRGVHVNEETLPLVPTPTVSAVPTPQQNSTK